MPQNSRVWISNSLTFRSWYLWNFEVFESSNLHLARKHSLCCSWEKPITELFKKLFNYIFIHQATWHNSCCGRNNNGYISRKLSTIATITSTEFHTCKDFCIIFVAAEKSYYCSQNKLRLFTYSTMAQFYI